MLDVRRLRTFLTAATEGSFTGAAKVLYMTHSAVSQQMAILEREAGMPLIERTSRGIVLTEAGRLLADRCTTLFGLLATMESELRDLQSPGVRVRLGAFPTASADLIPQVMLEFNRRYPHITLDFVPVHVGDIPDRLRDGSIHIGLGWDYESMPRQLGTDVRVAHLYDEPLDLLVPGGHPLAERAQVNLSEVAGERWIFRNHKPPYEDAFGIMCRGFGFEPNITLTTDDYQSIHGFVGAGLGVSLVPRLSLQVRHPRVVAVPLDTRELRRNVVALTLINSAPSEPTKRLIGVIRETVTELGEELARTTQIAHESAPAARV